MKKYKAIIFDLDGTLLNTLEDLQDSVNFALRQNELPEISYDEIRHFVGNGVERLIRLAVPESAGNYKFERVLAVFKDYYQLHCDDKTDLYPGIRELLETLKEQGYLMAIVSNKYQTGLDILKEQYFKEYLHVAIGEQSGIRKKPAPDSVFTALAQLETAVEEAIFVGDSEVDIATARNAGMECIAVEWGFRTKKEQIQAGGRLFAQTPEGILEYLNHEK